VKKTRKKALAKNPADGDDIDAARADDDRAGDPGPIDDYPRYTSDQPPRTNPMEDIAEGAAGIAAVGIGQAVTDEIVEALARYYGVGKGVMVHALIEAGVPVATGVAVQYATDNDYLKKLSIGMIAAGSVNAASIGVKAVKDWWANRQSGSDDDSGNSGTQGLAQLPPAQRQVLMQRLAGRQQSGAVGADPGYGERQRQKRQRTDRKSSGTLSASSGRRAQGDLVAM
jgi:hypothetical protein